MTDWRGALLAVSITSSDTPPSIDVLRSALWRRFGTESAGVAGPMRSLGGSGPGIVDLADAELLVRWRSHRDAEAADHLVRRHGGRVLAMARRSLSADDAEDVAQEVFLGLLGDPRKGAMPNELAAWLATLTRRRVIDFWVRRKRLATASEPVDEIEDAAMLAELERIDDLSDKKVRAARYAEALARQANPLEQEVFCRRLEGRSNGLIAADLGVSDGHVRVALSRALAIVRAVRDGDAS